MSIEVIHTGEVICKEEGSVYIEVPEVAACVGCHASVVCSSNNKKRREIKALVSGEEIAVGDWVEVRSGRRLGLKSVLLAYLLPAVCMVGALVICRQAGMDDVASALVSLLSMAIYYGVLYLNREKIEREIVFTAKKIEKQ